MNTVDEGAIISLLGQHDPSGVEIWEVEGSYFTEHLADFPEDVNPLLKEWNPLFGVGAEDVCEEGVGADSGVNPKVGAGYGDSWTGDQRVDG